LFDEVRGESSIPHWVEFKVLCSNKQKENPVKIQLSNELVQVLSEGVNFAVIINEGIFNKLPLDMQKLLIVGELHGISISDTDVVSKVPKDLCVHSGVAAKYGIDKLVTLNESVKSLYIKEKDDENKLKAANKGKRGKNRLSSIE
jgi:hypothetical protein